MVPYLGPAYVTSSAVTVITVLDFWHTWFSIDYNLENCKNDIQFVL